MHENEDVETPAGWLAGNGVDLAPLTGTDHRVLRAVAASWELYAYTKHEQAMLAIASLLLVMQPKCRPLTKKLIARAMDWSDVEPLWATVDAMVRRVDAIMHNTTPCSGGPKVPPEPLERDTGKRRSS